MPEPTQFISSMLTPAFVRMCNEGERQLAGSLGTDIVLFEGGDMAGVPVFIALAIGKQAEAQLRDACRRLLAHVGEHNASTYSERHGEPL